MTAVIPDENVTLINSDHQNIILNINAQLRLCISIYIVYV